MIKRSGWQAPSWYLNGVVVGDSVTHNAADASRIGSTDKGELFSWCGFNITLYKDACERYWHALIGDKPKIYVVCRDDVDEAESDLGIAPMLVTCDYDEAISYVETDELVLSAEIPAELYHYMEAFVLEHYKPKPFEKRKRKKWADKPDDRAPKQGAQH